jgi:antitoxin component YwqK of YwqJK toxin-antitoxin module
MKQNPILILLLTLFSSIAAGQMPSDTNKTDQQGRKQGYWVKRYPNKVIMYTATFRNDKPVGEFRRYSEDSKLRSVLVYSQDGTRAEATIYHPNGLVASKGLYINQKKEGLWQFYSEYRKGYLICKENYTNNLRNGLSERYYLDSTLAEKVNYQNDIKHGEYVQYHPNGKVCMKTTYSKGKIHGKFDVWADNGRLEITGQYINDLREGHWKFFNKNGTVKYEVNYSLGVPDNKQMIIDEADYLDSLEKNAGKIADPAKIGKNF